MQGIGQEVAKLVERAKQAAELPRLVVLPRRQESTHTLAEVRQKIAAGKSAYADNAMGVPPRYVGRTLPDSPEYAAAVKALDEGKGALLWGGCGSGKTHRAIMLARHWLANHLDDDCQPTHDFPLFLPVVELLQKIKATFGKEGEGEQELLASLAKRPLLILDDMGSEKVGEWSRQCLHLLIDRRYRDMKQTIVTTNLTLDQLAANDDRLTSRLVEMCEVVNLGANDYRVRV